MWRRNKRSDDTRTDDVEQESVARRSVLRMGGIAAAGAAAAAVAGAVNADPAGAANGDFLKLGTNGVPNASTLPTGLYYNNGPAYQQGFFGLGVIDQSTTAGVFDAEPAVGGVANNTNFGAGVQGIGTSGAKGVVGKSVNAAGVQGVSTTGSGVVAESSSVTGAVLATNHGTGPGIVAQALGTGPGVRASGKAVLATTGVGAGNAAALEVNGRAAFTRSGLLTIPAGAGNALTPLVAGGLSANSRVLATMQTVVAGTVAVKSAVPILSGAGKGKIQIYLTAVAPAGGVKVAWFVFG